MSCWIFSTNLNFILWPIHLYDRMKQNFSDLSLIIRVVKPSVFGNFLFYFTNKLLNITIKKWKEGENWEKIATFFGFHVTDRTVIRNAEYFYVPPLIIVFFLFFVTDVRQSVSFDKNVEVGGAGVWKKRVPYRRLTTGWVTWSRTLLFWS